MSFKGRTVALMVGSAIVLSSLLTVAVMNVPALSGHVNATGTGFSSQQMQKLNSVLHIIESNYIEPVEREKLVSGALDGMFAVLKDPYSTYMRRSEATSFNESVEGEFTGIGAEVSLEDGSVTVVSPIKDSPAEKAGLQPKDVLLTVDGESLDGKTLTEAVSKIRGPKGSTVKLEVKRPGHEQVMVFHIKRDKVDLETVYPSMLEGNIGYIELRQYSANTAERFEKALKELEAKQMKGLIIDVRNNPGGVLDTVKQMTELFVPNGKPILQVEYRDKKRDVYKSKGTKDVKPYPIAVLTNKGSASASEIMAAALQESAGAILVGDHTFGKGTVQASHLVTKNDGDLIKLTIAKWLTPDGKWIHEKGIEPDVKVAQPSYFQAAPIPKDKTLKLNLTSPDVANVQHILKGLGYSVDRVDGYFSPDTKQAVEKFQGEHSLPVTGEVNKLTAEKLEQAVIKAIRDPKNDAQLDAAIKAVQKEIR
ncbi:S41 family peptidase [Paenibacillus sp. SC116]|uniref:S41 family peptidase n=1 Tax=Paenibacillus sp. SC116 TaxID=2968986 RepID=UPI00215AF5CA|nr:S41 family peptidase [Paenibacillus sp. SC116]MCR8844832.1 S41 family peptidase [Paenibacillus sp. SC116]